MHRHHLQVNLLSRNTNWWCDEDIFGEKGKNILNWKNLDCKFDVRFTFCEADKSTNMLHQQYTKDIIDSSNTAFLLYQFPSFSLQLFLFVCYFHYSNEHEFLSMIFLILKFSSISITARRKRNIKFIFHDNLNDEMGLYFNDCWNSSWY